MYALNKGSKHLISLINCLSRTYHTSIGVIGIPFWYGQSKSGVNQAPDYLRAHRLINQLDQLTGRNVVDFGDIQLNIGPEQFILDEWFKRKGNPNQFNFEQVCNKIRKCVGNIIGQDMTALVIGGDHSVAAGSIMGSVEASCNKKEDLSVIWIDAHADANTVNNSLSGNLHGMPMSFILKNSEAANQFSTSTAMKPCLSAKNVVYIGLRDVEMQELRLLKALNIAYFSMRDVDKFGIHEVVARALDKVDPSNKNKLHVSFDVDSLDHTVIPSTGTPVLGGLSLREAFVIAEQIHSTGNMVALDVVEFNPTIGTEADAELTAKHVIDIILVFFGKSRIGYYSVQEENE